MTYQSQVEDVIEHLRNNGSITTWEAIQHYGITRLSAVIYILRHDYNYNITSEVVPYVTRKGYKSHFTRYVLSKNEVIQ